MFLSVWEHTSKLARLQRWHSGNRVAIALSLWGCSQETPTTGEITPQKPGTVSVLGTISGEQQAQLEAALVPFEEDRH